MADVSGLKRQLERKARIAMANTASDLESKLRRTSPIDSGEMRNRTTVRSRATANGAILEAKVDTPYAHIVSGGQRPHAIVPRNPGGVLVFESGDRTVFTKRVAHPGAQPRTWWTDAIRGLPDLLATNWRGVR
jgi:hypothetical protein